MRRFENACDPRGNAMGDPEARLEIPESFAESVRYRGDAS